DNIDLQAGSSLASGAGRISLSQMSGNSPNFVGAGTAFGTALDQRGVTIAIDLGGADNATTLGLTAAELNTAQTTGILQVGASAAGTITVSASVVLTSAPTLSLVTGGGIVDGNAIGADITVTNLALRAAGGMGAADDLNVAVSKLAFQNTGAAVNISN